MHNYKSYYHTLIRNSKGTTILVKQLRSLTTDIRKTLNKINPDYMKDIFKSKVNSQERPKDIKMQRFKGNKYGNKSLKSLGPEYGTTFYQI